MTKKDILQLAGNVDLMNKLNSLSGLLEVSGPDNEDVKNLLNEVYAGISNISTVTNQEYNKDYMLAIIRNKEPQLAEKLKSKARFFEIKRVYSELTCQ